MGIASIRLYAGAAAIAGLALTAVYATGGMPGARGEAAQPAAALQYEPLGWVKLMPTSWLERFRALNYGQMLDDDPRIKELLEAVDTSWDTAPTVAALDGRKVKIAGYIVPLEGTQEQLTEFLLVPYLGACIHTPPPPANQIVHVKSRVPLKGLHAMDIVSVSGTMKVAYAKSEAGVSGYALKPDLVEPYVAPARDPAKKGG